MRYVTKVLAGFAKLFTAKPQQGEKGKTSSETEPEAKTSTDNVNQRGY